MNDPKPNADEIDRRTVLRNSAIAVGGITAASGTASAGKGKGKGKNKKSAQAGWALARKETCDQLKYEKPKSFEVLYRTGTAKFPAGCSKNSAQKKYVCYKVRFETKNGNYKARIYRRKTQKQFKEGAKYDVKHVKSCGKNCRVHFKLQ